jgi:hypothetical protein
MNPITVYWDDWILFAAQILTLIALVVYVWKTWEMASATREAAEASARAVKETAEARLEAMAPRMLIYFGSEEFHWAEVVLENCGHGTAIDLSITFDPPLKASQTEWNANRFFETIKPVFPSRYRMVHSFDVWTSYLASNAPRQYSVRLSYKGKENGRSYEETHILDVAAIEYRSEFDRKSIHDLVQQLDKTTKAIESGFNSIHKIVEMESAIAVFDVEPTRTSKAYAAELVAAWDAANKIEETVGARFRREPLVRRMRSMAFQGYQAALRDHESEALRDAFIAVSRLVFVPLYAANQTWDSELKEAMEKLGAALPEFDETSISAATRLTKG